MDQSTSYVPPWKQIKLFKRAILLPPNSHNFETNANIWNTPVIEEEQTLHLYRNRISQYESCRGSADDASTDSQVSSQVSSQISSQVSSDTTKNWEYYKKVVNPYELVYTQKKYTDFPESFTILRPLSRSYFKMIEILDLINFDEMYKNENILTAHVCEGPGGFIEAIFEKVSKNKKIKATTAMTLRSKQANIPGWRRATKFLQKHRNISIVYGDDDSGDILRPENQQYFINKCTPQVHIFTADGGFDFSVDYGKQEQMIFPLLVASVRIGFEVLRVGGIFVIKVFDFYNSATVDLLYFMAAHFSEWTLYKPATSRPCNPEQYFIGKGFIGCNSQSLDYLRLWNRILCDGEVIGRLFKYAPQNNFMETINCLRTKSFKTQVEYLERVFNIIEHNNPELVKQYLKQHTKTSLEWCRRFRVPTYSSAQSLVVSE